MKIVAEIPNGRFKTTIFAWNNKYLIKYEAELFEQTYKVSQMDVTSEEDVKKLAINPEFLLTVEKRFESMAKDFFEQLDAIS